MKETTSQEYAKSKLNCPTIRYSVHHYSETSAYHAKKKRIYLSWVNVVVYILSIVV